MAYKFLEVIKDIECGLRTDADNANKEKQRIDARQTEIDAQLAALEPRLLRAQSLKSRDDLICAHCFINECINEQLRPIKGGHKLDLFRCGRCDEEYELHSD